MPVSISAARMRAHDLDRVAVFQLRTGPFAARHDRVVDRYGHAALARVDLARRQQIDQGRVGECAWLAVQADIHDAVLSPAFAWNRSSPNAAMSLSVSPV